MRQLPTGTVTFVFTDIEGSTRLLRELGDRYADVLAEHRRVLREVFERHGGAEMGTEGDAFFVAFTRASDAVAAATDGQAALAETPVRVRMGIHTGEPLLTDDGYVGMDVHRAARIAAAGHGGQVLLSEQTARLVDAPVRDLGRHRLKDIPLPERLYQLGDAPFPPLRTATRRALPAPATPLVGRERETAEITALLRESGAAVVTLVGPGGVGKTRVALEVAGEVEVDFSDGCLWVALGSVTDPALVVPTIGQALGGEGDGAASLTELNVLLVLDDFERVVAAAADVAALLHDAPGARVLATSRRPLRLSNERQYPLAPLTDADAEELFRRRAVAVKPAFEVDEAVAEICRRLDGLPLAIELAAARINVLAPAEIARRLDRRLPLLTTGPADAPARQRTLESTIGWSYDLLDEVEQTAFARLATFASWTLDAAEHVAEVDFETLASLVEKSLVREREGRFSMLETVREYALDRLAERGESDELGRRHAQYFVDLAETEDRNLFTSAEREWIDRVRAEHDNIRLALAWAQRAGAVELGLRLAAALWFHWFQRDYLDEGERWLGALLAAPGEVSDGVRARALNAAAMLVGVRGDIERAFPMVEESVALFRSTGDRDGLGRALLGLSEGLTERGEHARARAAVEEALPLLRESGNTVGEARALQQLGGLLQRAGDFEHARVLLNEALAIRREADAEFGLATALHSLGDLELDAGRVDEARARYAEGLRVASGLEALRVVCYCVAGLAAAAAAAGQGDRAGTLWRAARALELRVCFRLRAETAARYAALVGPFAEAGDVFAEESLLEDAVAYALREPGGGTATSRRARSGNRRRSGSG